MSKHLWKDLRKRHWKNKKKRQNQILDRPNGKRPDPLHMQNNHPVKLKAHTYLTDLNQLRNSNNKRPHLSEISKGKDSI